VPVIKEIIRIPKDEHLPLSKKKYSRKPRSKKREPQTESEEEDEDPEADWDAETPSHGVVLDFPSNDEVERSKCFPINLLYNVNHKQGLSSPHVCLIHGQLATGLSHIRRYLLIMNSLRRDS
jgi:hypothetical protein